jgi:hypothetical protein
MYINFHPMKYQVGDSVLYVGDSMKSEKGKSAVIRASREHPRIENNIISGATALPTEGFDYTISFGKQMGVDFILNVMEDEIA